MARRLAYPVYLLVVVLLGLEVLLRAFDPIGIEYLYEIHRYFKTMTVADERYGYIHKASHEGVLEGIPIAFNSHGLRGPEVATRKAEGRRRLLILGDSVVFGWGVEVDRTFPALLRQRLAELVPDVEVVPAGVSSWNTRTEYEYLRSVGLGFEPDVLLLLIVSNDLDPKREGRTEVDRKDLFPDKSQRSVLANLVEDFWRFASRNSYVSAYSKYFWEEHLMERGQRALDAASPQWLDARLALDGIIDLCREHGIALVVFMAGSEDMFESDNVLALYAEHLRTQGIEPHPYPEALAHDPRYRNSVVDGHANADGHALLAEAMLGKLLPVLAGSR
jgi:lysophospholipase L1-like esterase